ncbi:MAG: methylmalonyl-CoA mutase family protein [Deltaproteobacteria bacterium]|nr:methylmalonyl-CoA mutase family protein [Deltaproteobacteria bacterium]
MKKIDYLENLGSPGEFPFTRGVQPTMYRGRLWTMRQYAGFGTAEETNKRFKYLLAHGQTGLSVAFDLPTQMGYDSDHPMVAGEVGRVGVAIDTLEDMEELFRDIPLDKVSTSMTINATAAILLTLYRAVAEKQGVDPSRLRGTIQNDILKEYIARGTYIYPIMPSLRIVTDLFIYCQKEMPNWNVISVSGYHMREAGCTAIQEVAFTLLDAMTYLDQAIASGLTAESIAPQISFFFGVHNDFLEEISKFRAARRLWARIMKERYGVTNEEAMKLRFHSQTAGVSLTAQQPKNNIARVTLQALAAVLGGTQSLHTNSFDEALALPTEESARLALRTQQVIAHESGVTNTIDPVAGSYAIEKLTDEIEKGARGYLEKIAKMGGMVRAIEKGFIQQEIQNAAFAYQKKIEEKSQIVVGVNEFRDAVGAPLGAPTEGMQSHGDSLWSQAAPLHKIDPSIEKRQKEKLVRYKAKRDQKKVDALLKNLKDGAEGKENLIPLILDAVKNQATLGEISGTLKEVFGVYRENVVV